MLPPNTFCKRVSHEHTARRITFPKNRATRTRSHHYRNWRSYLWKSTPCTEDKLLNTQVQRQCTYTNHNRKQTWYSKCIAIITSFNKIKIMTNSSSAVIESYLLRCLFHVEWALMSPCRPAPSPVHTNGLDSKCLVWYGYIDLEFKFQTRAALLPWKNFLALKYPFSQ